MKNNYEQHVCEVAEEMAKGTDKGWRTHSEILMNVRINIFTSAACIAVRLQAEAFTEAWVIWQGSSPDSLARLNHCLIERGLIPAPEVKQIEMCECSPTDKRNWMCTHCK